MTPTARELLKPQMEKTPMARLAHPQEIADSIIYLASDRSSYITGTVLAVSYFISLLVLDVCIYPWAPSLPILDIPLIHLTRLMEDTMHNEKAALVGRYQIDYI